MAIARALVARPQVLLLDEPLGALDLKLRKDMQVELKKIQKQTGITFVFVTHDQEEALSMSDTVVVMSEGKIHQIGTPIDIYNEPQNAFVADFIGESNILDGTMLEDYKVSFSGQTFPCLDKDFGRNVPVDVVVRPEDVDIVPLEQGQLTGVVTSVTFMGVLQPVRGLLLLLQRAGRAVRDRGGGSRMKHTVTRDRRRMLRADYAALGPYSLWALLFILVPLVFVAYYAFTDNNFQFTLENVQRFFTATSSVLQEDGSSAEVHTYLLIFWRSLKLAVISTVICLVLAYPLAYIMARAKPRTQKIFLTIIMIPMWMNFLIRTYAWMTILQDTGIFNNFLTLLHLPNVHIIGTEAAVVIGMVYDYIPYMILPLYSIMAKMDEKLIEAARDLGCNGLGVLRRVIWPLSLPGVISGVTMVLIPSVSTFYISQKLGDGKIMLIGDVIEGQYVANNLHFAAAIAFILMILLLVCMAVMRKLASRHVEGGL